MTATVRHHHGSAVPDRGSGQAVGGRQPGVDGLGVVCAGVGKEFPDGTQALKDLSLDIPPSKILVLLGPSGCGKTTLLRSIAGLEPITRGHISVGDRPMKHGGRARRDIAMVFQNYGLYPSKNGFQNIEFPLRMAGVPRAERRARVTRIAELLHIEPLLRRRIHQLSGGQRQRIGIGRALVREPGLLLMDEPLSNLDAELRVRMRGEIKSLQRQLGTTLVFVTHDQAEALALADVLVVMRAGEVQQVGTPDEVYNRPATTFVASFLGAMNVLAIDDVRAADPRTGQALAAQGYSLSGSVGFRAEDFSPGPGDAGDLTLSGPVVLDELLGRERLTHFAVGGHTLRARVRAEAQHTGQFYGHIRSRDLHMFDDAGTRINEHPKRVAATLNHQG